MPYGIKGVFIALPLGVIFALEGFEQAAQLAGEARNPKRDIPLAVVGSMLLGAALYIALQVCFIGALNPANVAHGWANPFGNAGTFGPYYTLATSVGLGWLGTILIIDALISPGGTGLVYLATTSRLSYSLARTRFLPPVFQNIDRRGVPWFSIIFGGVFGCLLFLPFGGWAKLVGAITAASSFMYSYAPVAAVSLRRSDPDRPRPYRVPGLDVIAPFSFVVSGLIIYWSGTSNVVKLDLAVLFFLVLYFIARRLDPAQPPIDFRAGLWSVPWIARADDLLHLRRQLRGRLLGGVRYPDPPPPAVLVGHRRDNGVQPDRLLLCSAQPARPGAGRGERERRRGRRRSGGTRAGGRARMTTAAGSTTELLGLFPPGARVDADGELVIGGCPAG